LRLAQGLALGGEYGGAATYVAEHAKESKRGYDTSWIQTTATIGFFLALVVDPAVPGHHGQRGLPDWGWRIPFVISLFLLVFSIYIRPFKLEESPSCRQDQRPRARRPKAPLRESFGKLGKSEVRAAGALFGR